MQTYIIYILTVLIAVGLAHRADKKNKRIYITFAALVLTLVAGLRAATVGIDTPQYTKYFGLIAEGKLNLVYGLEDSFIFICGLLLKIWNNANFLYTVFALITNLLIFRRLWDFKGQVSLAWSVAVYCGMFYFMTFNIMRQFVAVAIIFYATKYIAQRKYIKFLLFVAIAFLFHKSAILGVLFIACEVFAWKHLSRRQKRFLLCAAMLVPVAAIILIKIFFSKYLRYLQNIQFNFGIMLLLKLALFVIVLLIGHLSVSGITKNDKYGRGEYTLSTVRTYYIVGLAITALGYIFPFADRIGIYFYIFEMVFMGMVAKHAKNQTIIKVCLIAIYAYVFLGSIFGNSHGQANYLFAWQV